MITIDQYFGKWLHLPEVTEALMDDADFLLDKVSHLMSLADYDNVPMPINPHTNSQVSGETYGGFRPQNCPIGAKHSSHKQAMAVDIYDPGNDLDDWITDDILEQCMLYREAPTSTLGWCHLTTRPPPSMKRTFLP